MSEIDPLGQTADITPPKAEQPTIAGSEPTLIGAPPGGASARETSGTRIGPYVIVRQLGEGGFGSVFEAEQQEPVRRRVALKIIKLGMDTHQIVARFEQERQALAILDHPNVAKVFDAGATETGRPYFVMELCSGVPIDRYCAENDLDTTERLELFAQVCAAIQHAHTKGLIHRDIKPSNVLVSTEDGKPNTKVIDFGIAKATVGGLSDMTVVTEHRQLIGTIEYMSPEQAEGSLDIDTRTDVYSLGVLLYELLTGTTPLEKETLRSAGLGDIPRIIREVEPPRPSTRISAITVRSSRRSGSADASAGPDSLPPIALGRMFRRELDWIVMKAMEKDRSRRYDSASEFAADIRRYLKNEPVVAAPPSTAYRVKKFVMRHTVGVTAAALVVLALGVGVTGTSVSLVRAVRAERLAVTEARTSQEALEFLVGLFAVVDPSEARGNTVTAREILDRGASRIEAELADQPVAQATLMSTMGTVYRSLGLYDEAVPLLERALAQRRSLLGPYDARVAETLNEYATLLTLQARYDEADSRYREALEIFMAAFGERDARVAQTRNDLANLLSLRGEFADAEPLYRQALEVRRELYGDVHQAVAASQHDLAMNLFDQGAGGEVVPLLRSSLAVRKSVFGPIHPEVAESLNSLALVLYLRGDLDRATPLFEEALDVQRRLVGEVHPDVAMAMNNLAFVLHDGGQLEAAELTYREVLEIQRGLLGDDHPDIARVLNNLAAVLHDQGRAADAERAARDSLAMNQRIHGDEHPDIAQGLNNLARWVQDRGDLEEAERMYREACDMRRRLLGDDHPTVAVSETGLANLLVEQGRFADARTLAEHAHEVLLEAYPDGHWRTFVAEGVIGAAVSGLGEPEAAEPMLLRSFEALGEADGPAIYVQDARRRLEQLYLSWGKPGLAAEYYSADDPSRP